MTPKRTVICIHVLRYNQDSIESAVGSSVGACVLVRGVCQCACVYMTLCVYIDFCLFIPIMTFSNA